MWSQKNIDKLRKFLLILIAITIVQMVVSFNQTSATFIELLVLNKLPKANFRINYFWLFACLSSIAAYYSFKYRDSLGKYLKLRPSQKVTPKQSS
jgi:hypothetical protein